MGGDGGAQREGSERNLDACWMQMTFVGRINPLPCAQFNSLIHVPRFKASQRVLLHYVCSMPHSISLASLSLSPIHPPLPLSISLSLCLSLSFTLYIPTSSLSCGAIAGSHPSLPRNMRRQCGALMCSALMNPRK